MNVDTLLRNFAAVVNSPKGLDQVRLLILRLAIQGRLVAPGREDASEILRELREIRNVVTSKKKRGAVALPTRVPDELGFQIPQHWSWTQFGELGDWGAGATPNRADKSYYGGKMPWYKSGELNDGVLGTAEEFITEKALSACSLRINEPGDVLVAMYGATIGKVGIASVRCTTNQAVCACTPFEGVFNRYLLILLKALKPWFIANAAGAAQPNYSKDKIIRTSAPLPPLEEQKRIVAKVDELMRLCDRLEAQQQEREKLLPLLSRANHSRFVANPTLDNLVSIFRSPEANEIEDIQCTVINLALQGRLTSQEKRDIPANEALFNVRQIKGISSSSIETVASLHQVPSSWTWIRVKDLVPEFQNGVSSRGDADGTPVVVLRLADIRDRNIVISEPRFIPIRQLDQRKYSLNKGDVLITRVNGSADIVGTFILVDNALDAIYCDHFIRMRIDQKVIVPKFLNLIGDSPLIRQQIRRLFVTTAGQKTVNQTHIGSLAFPLPPVNEQNRIVEIVERLMDTARDLQMKRRQSLATLESFANAAVAAITSTEFTENEKMQAPKTKVITALKVTKEPKKTDKAPLASLLFQQGGEVSAKALWKQSNFREIDAFYRQLKTEMANGWIEEDTSKREVKEVEVG